VLGALAFGAAVLAGIGAVVWFKRSLDAPPATPNSAVVATERGAKDITSDHVVAPPPPPVSNGSSAKADVGSSSPAEPPHPTGVDAPPTTGTKAVRVEHPTPGTRAVLPDAAIAPAPAVTRHRVTINTKPFWSTWTVDDDPTPHTSPERIELSVGAHKIHFTGNPHFKADKTITLDVPDHDVSHVETLDEL